MKISSILYLNKEDLIEPIELDNINITSFKEEFIESIINSDVVIYCPHPLIGHIIKSNFEMLIDMHGIQHQKWIIMQTAIRIDALNTMINNRDEDTDVDHLEISLTELLDTQNAMLRKYVGLND
jgi:hypothetical protein